MPRPVIVDGQRYSRPETPPVFRSRRRLAVLGLMLVWGYLAVQLVGGRNGLLRLMHLDEQVEQRSEQVHLAQARVERLDDWIEQVRNDALAQEQVAREKHQFTTPGAIVFRFEDVPGAATEDGLRGP